MGKIKAKSVKLKMDSDLFDVSIVYYVCVRAFRFTVIHFYLSLLPTIFIAYLSLIF